MTFYQYSFIFNSNMKIINAYSENLENIENHVKKITHNSAIQGYPSLFDLLVEYMLSNFYLPNLYMCIYIYLYK